MSYWSDYSPAAQISYNDPRIPRVPEMRKHSVRLESKALTAQSLADQDCVLICTDHSRYDWPWIVANSQLVVDTRNATKDVRDHRERIVFA